MDSTPGHYGPKSGGGGEAVSATPAHSALSPASSKIDLAKIFVGGLSWQTTEETLRYHFEQYGEVVSVEVMRDRVTGDPRGFAFVVFKDDATVDLVLSSKPHEINHKVVDVKRAQARGQAPPSIHKSADGSVGGGGRRRLGVVEPESAGGRPEDARDDPGAAYEQGLRRGPAPAH